MAQVRDDEFRRGAGGFGAGAGPFGRPRGGYGARGADRPGGEFADETELDHFRSGRSGDAVLSSGPPPPDSPAAGRRLLGGAHAASDEVL